MNFKIIRSSWLFVGASCATVLGTPLAVRAQSDQIQAVASTKTDTDGKSVVDEKHPLFMLLQIAYKAQKALEPINDYECIFVKRELVGKKVIKTTMNLKFREEPSSVYLKFVDANAGREVIYVQGQNGNKLLVHEAGIKAVLGTFTLLPTGPDAMAENRYPITSIGLTNMLNTVVKQWELEGKFGSITTRKYENSKSPTGESCTVYEALHSQQFKEFKFQTTRLWVEDVTGMAIGVQQYGFPVKNEKEPPLVEEYFYGKIKTNVKLTDNDFSPNNPSYTFK